MQYITDIMITFRPIIENRKADGTWPVRIRITFKRQSRRLATSLVCTDNDITRSGRIKNATILDRANTLIGEMRATCADLSFFTLEEWGIDQVVRHIRSRMAAETFRLDFFEFADAYILTKKESTRGTYITALNAFERYLGERRIDINDITRRMMLAFVKWYDTENADHKVPGGASATHVGKIAHIYKAAKFQYNDEDADEIRIPRNPFEGLAKHYPPTKRRRCASEDTLQRLIDYQPETELDALCRAVVLFSFLTMGANMADMWAAKGRPSKVWTYNRAKTRDRRADGAEVKVRLEDEVRSLLPILTKGEGDWWLKGIHHWVDKDGATRCLNRWLEKWCRAQGVEVCTLYSFRHLWATLGRRIGIEKATIDEALGHIGDYKIADIYAERNWQLAWDANRRIIDLFRW